MIAAATSQPSLIGIWEAVDPDSKKTYAYIEFIERGNSVSGYIRRVAEPAGTASAERCSSRCPGDKAGAPIIGLEAIWGLKPTSLGQYDGGQVLVPEDGFRARCAIEVSPSGDSLEIHIYVGMPMFGSSERWRRIQTLP